MSAEGRVENQKLNQTAALLSFGWVFRLQLDSLEKHLITLVVVTFTLDFNAKLLKYFSGKNVGCFVDKTCIFVEGNCGSTCIPFCWLLTRPMFPTPSGSHTFMRERKSRGVFWNGCFGFLCAVLRFQKLRFGVGCFFLKKESHLNFSLSKCWVFSAFASKKLPLLSTVLLFASRKKSFKKLSCKY